jgi:hypothetical protein
VGTGVRERLGSEGLRQGLVPFPVHKFRIPNAGIAYKPEAQAKDAFQARLRRLGAVPAIAYKPEAQVLMLRYLDVRPPT